jgi:hypothetical protein
LVLLLGGYLAVLVPHCLDCVGLPEGQQLVDEVADGSNLPCGL